MVPVPAPSRTTLTGNIPHDDSSLPRNLPLYHPETVAKVKSFKHQKVLRPKKMLTHSKSVAHTKIQNIFVPSRYQIVYTDEELSFPLKNISFERKHDWSHPEQIPSRF